MMPHGLTFFIVYLWLTLNSLYQNEGVIRPFYLILNEIAVLFDVWRFR